MEPLRSSHIPSLREQVAVFYFQLGKYDKTWSDVHKAQALGYNVNPIFINVLKQVSGKDE